MGIRKIGVPGGAGEATIAAITAAGAAGNQILSGDLNLRCALGGNADAIAHGLGGAECPAGTAGALIANQLNT